MPERSSIHELISNLVPSDGVDRLANPVEARKKAMDYLARREHSRDELVRKLESSGFVPDTIVEAVDRLREDGLQSDQRFAEAFAQSRISQGKGPVRIRSELRQRGIDGVLIDDVFDEIGVNWRSLAKAVRAKKFGESLPVDFRAKARQMRFLQYRGFEPDQVQSAVAFDDEAWDESGPRGD